MSHKFKSYPPPPPPPKRKSQVLVVLICLSNLFDPFFFFFFLIYSNYNLEFGIFFVVYFVFDTIVICCLKTKVKKFKTLGFACCGVVVAKLK